MHRNLKNFEEGGQDRLRRLSLIGKTSALSTHQTSLEGYFREHPPSSAREAQTAISQQTGDA